MYQKIYEVFHNKYNSAGVVFTYKKISQTKKQLSILTCFVNFLIYRSKKENLSIFFKATPVPRATACKGSSAI